ncbi:MAG: hypothetical protein Q7K16_03575 [Candidatus Azambacteria bacterium]|nr:hypothetical protein [Candidatus Azambacteria bacterium]
MPVIITTILILVISLAVWLLNRATLFRLRSGQAFKICPVCAGISLTWLLISAGIVGGLLGADNWKIVIAIAMGGTVTGIAFQAEKKFEWHNPMIKLAIIIVGFVLAYFAINNISLWVLIFEAGIILSLCYLFFIFRVSSSANTVDPKKLKELEEKMKDCC